MPIELRLIVRRLLSRFFRSSTQDMLSDDVIRKLEEAVEDCDEARSRLVDALDAAEAQSDKSATTDPSVLQPVGDALSDWRDAEQQFMDIVEASGAPNPSTAALLLKTNHGVDSSNARRGIPGTSVDGADQPFDIDMIGVRGSVVTEAATEYLRE